jgi:hypothetical protein
MHLRRSRRLLSALALALALVAGSTAGAQAQVPEAARIRHQSGPHWVWFGPANYAGSGSAYGITITGPGGAVLDMGFSNLLCSPGATWNASVANYFRAKRQGLINQGYQLLTASNIVRPNGTGVNYRRQNLTWRRTVGGVQKRGIFQFDYDFATNVSGVNYCYARNLGEYSNTAVWRQRQVTLRNINNSLAYSGPGACDPSPSTPC